jgi:hypothetical protein
MFKGMMPGTMATKTADGWMNERSSIHGMLSDIANTAADECEICPQAIGRFLHLSIVK